VHARRGLISFRLHYGHLSSITYLGEYHKYDTIVYPKKTKSWTEKVSNFFSKQFGDSKEEEELTPMGFYDMNLFCLYGYLSEYKNMVCQGRFQQGANIDLDADSVAHIFRSLSKFSLLRAMNTSGNTVVVEVPSIFKFKQVCTAATISA
jgi:hypothetical protein